MGRVRRAKRQFTKKTQRAVCSCVTRSGEPKTLFPEKYIASRTAGDTMVKGKMWEVYRCRNGGAGWHIATVRWDPWSKSQSDSPEEAR